MQLQTNPGHATPAAPNGYEQLMDIVEWWVRTAEAQRPSRGPRLALKDHPWYQRVPEAPKTLDLIMERRDRL
jgi:hypothetical protein